MISGAESPATDAPAWCATWTHERVPAAAIGVLDDDVEGAVPGVAYCALCAVTLTRHGSYRITDVLDAPALRRAIEPVDLTIPTTVTDMMPTVNLDPPRRTARDPGRDHARCQAPGDTETSAESPDTGQDRWVRATTATRTGMWRVVTQTACYFVDFDARQICRLPRSDTPVRLDYPPVAHLRRDGEWLPLLVPVTPTIGKSMTLNVAVRSDGVESLRLTTPVVALEMLATAEALS